METYTLVTGASDGIGKEFARIAAAKGRRVIVTARSTDKLEALAEALRTQAEEVVVLTADLADPEGADAVFAAATEGRAIDIFVNNAGLGAHGPFDDPASWAREEATIAVNIRAATRMLKLMVPHMTALGTRARIVNMASIAAFMPGPNMAVYHASKAYLLSLSEALSQELKGTQVTVTALCPGATQTGFFDAADMHGVRFARGRLPTARAVAQAGWDAAIVGRPVIVPGGMNKLMTALPRIAPRGVVAAITARFQERD
ncbi:MAG: SDR family oxidoreductase [Pseudomonadota bacterium]